MIEKIYPTAQWSHIYFGNTLGAYTDAVLLFLLILVGFAIVVHLFLRSIRSMVKKTDTPIDNAVLVAAEALHPPFYVFVALYIALTTLTLSTFAGRIAFVVLVVWLAWKVMQVMTALIGAVSTAVAPADEEGKKQAQATTMLLGGTAKIILWAFVIIIILGSFGINVTSLLAAAGIGGIAIAFAVKGILEDLFSSFSLYFDKPFLVGDAIKVDGEVGTVQHIGIKTTRLTSVSTGEEIVFANSDLTKKKIHNFRKMRERRVMFSLGVTYETETAKLEKIPTMIKEIIEAQECTDYKRTHFRAFGDSALTFKTFYFITTRDYATYLDIHQAILYGIRKRFEKEGIVMAYPTQTLHITK